ncbi:lytic polysaccharide monooxygenase, partial [Streptomyces hundungensis]
MWGAGRQQSEVEAPSGRSGRHVVVAVWTIADTGNAFYACSDV